MVYVFDSWNPITNIKGAWSNVASLFVTKPSTLIPAVIQAQAQYSAPNSIPSGTSGGSSILGDVKDITKYAVIGIALIVALKVFKQ
jgi:hypothetical protein